MTLIGLGEVHVADLLNPLEVQLALLVVSVQRGRRQEQFEDDEEADDRVAIELESLIVDGFVSRGGSHGLHHQHEVLLHKGGQWHLRGRFKQPRRQVVLLQVYLVSWILQVDVQL